MAQGIFPPGGLPCSDAHGGESVPSFPVPRIEEPESGASSGKNEKADDLDDDDIDVKTAIVPVPSVLPRIVALPEEPEEPGKKSFVLLEDVIRYFGQQLFVGYDILEARVFRLTRDADLDIDEEDIKDLVVEVERQLRKRQKGEAVRLEFEAGTSRFMQRFMVQSTNLEKGDLYEIDGPIDLTMYFGFCGIKGYDRLRYPEAHPRRPWSSIQMGDGNIFDMIRQKDMLIHLPYESFNDSVVKFVSAAAEDKDVLAIKQTLYRVSSDSPIIRALEKRRRMASRSPSSWKSRPASMKRTISSWPAVWKKRERTLSTDWSN